MSTVVNFVISAFYLYFALLSQPYRMICDAYEVENVRAFIA